MYAWTLSLSRVLCSKTFSWFPPGEGGEGDSEGCVEVTLVCWLLVTTLVVMEDVVGGCDGIVVGENALVGLVVGREVVGRIVIGDEVGLGNGNAVGDSVNPVVLVGRP